MPADREKTASRLGALLACVLVAGCALGNVEGNDAATTPEDAGALDGPAKESDTSPENDAPDSGTADPDASDATDTSVPTDARDASAVDVAPLDVPPLDVPGLDAPSPDTTVRDVPLLDVPPDIALPDVPAIDRPPLPDVPAIDRPTLPDVPVVDVGIMCPPTQTLCGGLCATLGTDPMNCGACGRVCAAGYICSMGSCSAICAAGLTQCGASCVNLAADTANCGACGMTCLAPPGSVATCVASTCGLQCMPGYGNCNGTTVDGCETALNTTPTRCGSCTTSCPVPTGGSATCSAGVCGVACSSGRSNCGGACVATNTVANCGSCGRTCLAPTGGSVSCLPFLNLCTPTCPGSQTVCGASSPLGLGGGACRDLGSDVSNCGACGNRCPAAPAGGTMSCVGGVCTSGCPSSQVLCAGACVAGPCTSFTGYDVAGTSPQAWVEACATPGFETDLAGTDDSRRSLNLPFAFTYWGAVVAAGTSTTISSNGWYSLVAATSSLLPTSFPGTGAPNGTLMPHGDDLTFMNGNSSPRAVCWVTLGAAPNRQFVVEWSHAAYYSMDSPGYTGDLMFEVVLTETTNTIDFIYNRMNGISAAMTGIENVAGTQVVTPCGSGTSCALGANRAVRFTPR